MWFIYRLRGSCLITNIIWSKWISHKNHFDLFALNRQSVFFAYSLLLIHNNLFFKSCTSSGGSTYVSVEFIIEGTCFGTKLRSITSYTKSTRVANSGGKNQYM